MTCQHDSAGPRRRTRLPTAHQRALQQAVATETQHTPDTYAPADGIMAAADGDIAGTLATVNGLALDRGELLAAIMERLALVPPERRILAAMLLADHWAKPTQPDNEAMHQALAMAWRRLRTVFTIEGVLSNLLCAEPGTKDALRREALASRTAACNAFWASGIRLAALAMPAGINTP